MNRVSSSSSSSSSSAASSSSSASPRTTVPGLTELPDEAFLNIVSFIDKADNKTLCSLASASHDCWRLVSVDSLRSFFYAASESFLNAPDDDKSKILAAVLEWLPKVSDQMPAATVNAIWGQLIDMMNNAGINAEDKYVLSEKILDSLSLLMQRNLNEADAIEVMMLVSRASSCFSTACEALSLQIKAANNSLHEQLNAMR